MLQKLVKFGLSEKEAQIYLALLELGPSSVSEIAKRAKVSRTNTYHLLNSLTAQGLVNSHEKLSKVIFSAENPERIIQMLKNKADKYNRLLQEAEDLMPELKPIYNQKDGKLRIRFYEGVEGVISAYEDTLTAKTEIWGYALLRTEFRIRKTIFAAKII